MNALAVDHVQWAELSAVQRLESVRALLGSYSYRFRDERDVHAAIAEIFAATGIPAEHEFVLDAQNRADFWLDGLVIEVKIKGSFPEALRQVHRYCGRPEVSGVLLLSTLRWRGRCAMPATLHGKPARLGNLSRAFM